MQTLEANPKMEPAPLLLKPSRRTWRSRLARWAIMLVIFSAGGVAGYSVKSVQMSDSDGPTRGPFRPERFTEYLHAELRKDLSLTENQSPKVKDILVRRGQKFDELFRQTQPLFEKAMAELDREMQSVLTADQWKLYQERRARRHRRPPPGGPGRGGSGWGRGERGPGHEARSSHDSKGSSHAKRPSDHSKRDGSQDESKTAPPAEPVKVEAPTEKPVESK